MQGGRVPLVAVVLGEHPLLVDEDLAAHRVVGRQLGVRAREPDPHEGPAAELHQARAAGAASPSRPPPNARSKVDSAEHAWQRTQPARAFWLIIPASASIGATGS